MRCGEFFMKFFGEKKLKPTLVETDFSYHYKVGGSMICYLYFCCLEEPFDIFLHLTNYRISKPNITITQIELQRHLKLFWPSSSLCHLVKRNKLFTEFSISRKCTSDFQRY